MLTHLAYSYGSHTYNMHVGRNNLLCIRHRGLLRFSVGQCDREITVLATGIEGRAKLCFTEGCIGSLPEVWDLNLVGTYMYIQLKTKSIACSKPCSPLFSLYLLHLHMDD